MLYDLNGFKRYNDTFGHPAGDALLARLSDKLKTVVAPYGTAYRMGGDEFCVLLRNCAERLDALVAASVAALSERGPGFSIGAAHGVVSIPPELDDPAAVMQLADQRLYRRKDETREASADRSKIGQQLRDVLLQAFEERHPDLQEHQRGVGALVLEVGRRLGMAGEELDVLARAAELHDVGKIAIPDAILTKPGTLNAEEWRFMNRHTILGERILTAAAALRPVARASALKPRALRRKRLPGRPPWGRDPDGRADHLRVRRVRRDDLRALLQRSCHSGQRDRGAARLRGHPVRSHRRRGLRRLPAGARARAAERVSRR